MLARARSTIFARDGHAFGHRFGTYEAQNQEQANQGKLPELSDTDHANPNRLVFRHWWLTASKCMSALTSVHRGLTQWLVENNGQLTTAQNNRFAASDHTCPQLNRRRDTHMRSLFDGVDSIVEITASQRVVAVRNWRGDCVQKQAVSVRGSCDRAIGEGSCL
jgi:hypothetical protein